YIPLLGVRADQTDRLESIVHRISLDVISIAAQTIAEDDGVHAMVVEEGNEVGALRADIECVVSPSRRENDGGARIDAAFHRVQLDGRVVDVDNAADPSGHRL